MSELSIPSKILLAGFAACTFAVPVILGAAAQAGAEPQPLIRIAPNYPTDALAARRDGEVQLEFTIAANGTTKDIVVVDSSSPEFEEPAVAALSRWRYSPTNVECVGTVCTPIPNAVAEERRGVRTLLRFQLASVNPQAEAE